MKSSANELCSNTKSKRKYKTGVEQTTISTRGAMDK